MGLFRRSAPAEPTSVLPADIVTKMDAFGRSEFYNSDVGYPGSIPHDIVVPLHQVAQRDPDRFIRELAEAVLPVGSWAVFGGARIVWDVLSADVAHPDYFRIMDAALDFLRSQGCPPMRVAGYQWQYWVTTRGRTEPWLPATPPPAEDDVFLTPLGVDEERLICRLWDAPDSNEIVAVRRGPDTYVAQVEARQSDDDPTRARRDLYEKSSLYDLFVQVGGAMGSPPHWYHGDLRRFFPLPECLL